MTLKLASFLTFSLESVLIGIRVCPALDEVYPNDFIDLTHLS